MTVFLHLGSHTLRRIDRKREAAVICLGHTFVRWTNKARLPGEFRAGSFPDMKHEKRFPGMEAIWTGGGEEGGVVERNPTESTI